MKSTDFLCLGTVKLGSPDYGFSSSNCAAEFDAVGFLKQVESRGVIRFDTSPRYGKSEELLGQYISQSRTQPLVSSKIDNLTPGSLDNPEKMVTSVKASLRKLNLSRLDVCYLHQDVLDIITDRSVHEGLRILKKDGLICRTGASLYSFAECEYCIGSGSFDVIQVPVSVFDLTYYDRFIRSNDTSVRFIGRSLLLQGILVNRDLINSRIKQSRQVWDYLKKLDELALECGISTLELGLAFVFSLSGIDNYVIGTTSIENLDKDIRCLNRELPVKIFERLLEMASEPKEWVNPRNWN